MANYVKFRRGTVEAFKNFPKDQLKSDTLYFIFDEDADTADLYLGDKLISSGAADQSSAGIMSLVKLSDVIIQAPQSGDVLIYDSTTSGTGAWINKPLQSIIEDATVVDVENIKGLSEWLQSHAGNTPGLSEQNFTQDLYIKLSDSLFISSVDNFNFKVVAGELKINTINQSQVANLEQILNSKASINDIAVIDSKVQDLSNILNGYTPEGSQEPVLGLRAVISNVQVNVQNNTEAIEVLNQHLTWQDLK